MKKIPQILIISLFLSCNKKSESVHGGFPNYGKILLLRIDYMSQVFEAGTEINLSTYTDYHDSIPVKREYVTPSDFGNVRLLYKGSNDTLFDGSICWMGKGRVKFPHIFDTATTFKRLPKPINKPNPDRFQNLHDIGFHDSLPWHAVNNLEVIKNYMAANKKIGYFLYTPELGMWDPYSSKWFLVLSR